MGFNQVANRNLPPTPPANPARSPVSAAQAASYQLLIGRPDDTANDLAAAAGARLSYEQYAGSSYQSYIIWIKRQMRAGAAVTACVYHKETSNPSSFTYDHIVSVAQYISAVDDDVYRSADIIVLADHEGDRGLNYPGCSTESCLYPNLKASLQSSTVGALGATRAASKTSALLWSIPTGGWDEAGGGNTWEKKASRDETFMWCMRGFVLNSSSAPAPITIPAIPPDASNYGIAHLGPAVTAGETLLPVRVDPQFNYEKPEVAQGTNPARPASRAMWINVTVSGLSPGAPYLLYQWNSEVLVPTSGFGSGAASLNAAAVISFVGPPAASATTFSFTIQSSDKRFFRAARQLTPAPSPSSSPAPAPAPVPTPGAPLPAPAPVGNLSAAPLRGGCSALFLLCSLLLGLGLLLLHPPRGS